MNVAGRFCPPWLCCLVFGHGSVEAQGRLRSRKFKSGRFPQLQDRHTNWCICNGLPCGRVFRTRLHGLAHESGRRHLQHRVTTMAPSNGVGGAAGVWCVWCGVCVPRFCVLAAGAHRVRRGVGVGAVV